jgi:hypothetical protein
VLHSRPFHRQYHPHIIGTRPAAYKAISAASNAAFSIRPRPTTFMQGRMLRLHAQSYCAHAKSAAGALTNTVRDFQDSKKIHGALRANGVLLSAVARKAREKITQASTTTLGMLDEIKQVCDLVGLHMDKPHGNQTLHDDMVLGVLLSAFFEPVCRSLRTMDQLSEVPGVKELVGTDRVARSTLSDALGRFDVSVFDHVTGMLRRKLPELKHTDPVLDRLSQQVIAGDGSSFRMAGEVAWALQRRRDGQGRKDSQAKLHLQLDVRRWTMEQLRLTGGRKYEQGGSEQKAMASMVQADVIYLLDRGYCGFDLMRTILDAKSSFVLRLKKDIVFRPQQDKPLSEQDRQAGIAADQLGLVGKADEDMSLCNPHGPGRESKPPEQLLRQVKIWDDKSRNWVLLVTDLLDIEAWVIGYLYRCRWIIELFFRWLKITAGFAHLFSTSANGVKVQMYVALIGTLLIYLRTGLPVSKYSFVALGLVASGQARYEDVLPGLLRLERQRTLERQRLARNKAKAAAAASQNADK